MFSLQLFHWHWTGFDGEGGRTFVFFAPVVCGMSEELEADESVAWPRGGKGMKENGCSIGSDCRGWIGAGILAAAGAGAGKALAAGA